MASRRKVNSKGMLPNGRGAGKSTFVRVPHALLSHPDYVALSKTARAFLVDFCAQYNGYNHGKLSGAPGIMGKYGWDKKTALRCRKELEERGWLVVTRYPRAKKEPILYRLSWLDLDEWTGRPILDDDAYSQKRKSLNPDKASISKG